MTSKLGDRWFEARQGQVFKRSSAVWPTKNAQQVKTETVIKVNTFLFMLYIFIYSIHFCLFNTFLFMQFIFTYLSVFLNHDEPIVANDGQIIQQISRFL